MLRLVIVDSSAESRNRMAVRLNGFASQSSSTFSLLPRISIKPLTLGELKLHSPPDLCIIGDEYLSTEPSVVASIKRIIPDTALLGLLPRTADALLLVEQLAQHGLSDCFTHDTTSIEFFQKVILLVRRVKQGRKGGKLVLIDSGKGGVGVTTVAAAVGDALSISGKRTVLVDLDSESQDVTRFLQARPFVNENLQQLLDGSKTISEETVSQCLVPVWDEEDFFCMSPAPLSEELHDPRSGYHRGLMSILEILDETHDFIVVDAGGAPTVLLKMLYRAADSVLFVINNDPATLFSAATRAQTYRRFLSPQASFSIIENGSRSGGLGSDILRREFSSAARVEEDHWVPRSIPWSGRVLRWPASGYSPLGVGGSWYGNTIFDLLRSVALLDRDLGLARGRAAQIFSHNLLRKVLPFFQGDEVRNPRELERSDRRIARALPQTLRLPAAQDLFKAAEVK